MTDKVMDKWKKKLRNMKKEDYIVLLLVGVLLLIITLPTEKEKAGSGSAGESQGNVGLEGGTITEFLEEPQREAASHTEETALEAANFNNNTSSDLETYVENLEKRAAGILSGMEGAGKVQVMITVSDMGTEILERDSEITAGDLEETDNAGGSRKNTESTKREEVIYKKDAEGNQVPYVVQRKLPEVTGVVVIAEGAGNAKVKENIIGAVSVLFNLNEHRIKVIRMKS